MKSVLTQDSLRAATTPKLLIACVSLGDRGRAAAVSFGDEMDG